MQLQKLHYSSPTSNATTQLPCSIRLFITPAKGLRRPHPERIGKAPRNLRTSNAESTSTSTSFESSRSSSPPKDYFAEDQRPVILYDGVCNLCNGAVNLMLDLDPDGSRFRMAALQSTAGRSLLQSCGRRPDDISSIVVVEPGNRHYIRSEAILKIASGLSDPFPLLAFFGFPVPSFFRDAMYDQVANNRYSFFGQSNVCRLSNDGQEHRFIVE